MPRGSLQSAPGENTPLLNDPIEPEDGSQEDDSLRHQDEYDEGTHQKSVSVVGKNKEILWKKNLVLLLGVFLVNADSSILLAMFRQIASDFDALQSAPWIINSYILGLIIAQPLVGKLSDIYGRKPLLIFAYLCYCVGGLVAGIGFSFGGILAGRAIAGVGNAGITTLVSTLIVDLVPMQDVALWRGFVYAVNQFGRALGPPLGGFLSDSSDWRWALLYQVPINALSLVFVWSSMTLPTPRRPGTKGARGGSIVASLRRIDFLGATSLGVSNCSLLLFLDQIQKSLDVAHNPAAITALATWAGFLCLFIMIEAFWAREPILPLKLLVQRNVFSTYCIQFLQTAAQMGLFTSVPLFFRITVDDSSTMVSVRLLIITVGTIIGGLISGFFIRRTGLYRVAIWLSLLLSNASFLAILLRWRGPISWAETLYGFPCGVGFGVSLSAAFIGLTAGLDTSKVAVSTSGFYLSLNLGSLFGVSMASIFITNFVEQTLLKRFEARPDGRKIIEDVTKDINAIARLPSALKEIVVAAYTESLVHVWYFTLVCGCLAFLSSFIMREGNLARKKDEQPQPGGQNALGRLKAYFIGR